MLSEAIKGKYTVKDISEKTGLSERRIKQLKASYKFTGIESVIHGNISIEETNERIQEFIERHNKRF